MDIEKKYFLWGQVFEYHDCLSSFKTALGLKLSTEKRARIIHN